MATTYEPIATTTLTSAQATVSFTSISGSFTDLVLIGNGYLATQDGYAPRITFNSDTGNNYSFTQLGGNGTTASSAQSSNRANIPMAWLSGWDTNSTQPGMFIAQIMNYSNATTYKTILSRASQTNGTYPAAETLVGLWRSTSAISSMTIAADVATFASGSTFTLYGIASA